MEIIENRGLLLTTAYPEQITSVIPKSAVVESGKVLVHWNLKAAQTLVQLGFKDVPSPIAKSYKYHGRNSPFAHQKKMAEFCTLHHRCFNFSDMGTGKSRASAWAADYLMEIGLVKRVLILSPLSILKTAWEADIFATAMHRSTGIAIGTPARRKKIINSGCDFVIINHDGVKSSFADLMAAQFDLIIVDEATAFSNTQTDRWKALNKLVHHNNNPMLWMLTGTPAANSPLQAFGLAKLVSPERVPKFFTAWKDMTMFKVSTFTFTPKPDAQKMVFDALQPAIRFDKVDCVDLPPVTFVEREFEMDPQQYKYYMEMKAEMLMEAAEKQITAVNTGVLMGKLMQIASGAVYSDDGSVIDFRAKTRLREMLDVINDSQHKVLVFASFKHTIRTIMETLEAAGIEAAAIDGDTSPDARSNLINTFQNTGLLKVLVLQPKVASHGITLTAANVAIWFTPTSSLETWRQANDRINRIGQKNKMTVVKLIGSPIERKVYSILERRDSQQNDLLNLYREELNS